MKKLFDLQDIETLGSRSVFNDARLLAGLETLSEGMDVLSKLADRKIALWGNRPELRARIEGVKLYLCFHGPRKIGRGQNALSFLAQWTPTVRIAGLHTRWKFADYPSAERGFLNLGSKIAQGASMGECHQLMSALQDPYLDPVTPIEMDALDDL